jgi:predicted component of type VI protein secretion system
MEASSERKRDYGAKEEEASNGRVCAAGFHHVTARSRLAHFLKLTNRFAL